ncbi:hypothetical protein COCCU_00770 [Corynebacterium occultum]|uniref:Uncharacterized protein n=1 Tax=Corynebacterium occultum TaxID=2675219 RepID=A0A6B8VL11_9CORY|nr:hypothetical protein [Corynebacterium occultum]QGU06122.1 hypothetical protein COCCU_00770 [Corynebacterium occultum]
MSTITLENVDAVQVSADEPHNSRNNWVAQTPLATLAACTTALVLFLDSRRKA